MPRDLNTISILLGGMNVWFEAAFSEIPLTISPAYVRFISTAPPEFLIRIHAEEYQGISLGIPCFTASHWLAYPYNNEGIALQFGNTNMPPGKFQFTFLLDGSGQCGDLYLNQRVLTRDQSPLALPPGMLDEVMTLSLLARRKGMIFHACAIQQDEFSAIVFAGISGSGKTTTARLWQEHKSSNLLGDERVVVRFQDGHLMVFATPWISPEFVSTPASAPLTRVFILKHGLENHARRLEIVESVHLLLARCYLPAWDAAGMEYTLEFLEEICRTVPCYEFSFTPDQHAVDYVKWLIEN